MNCFDCATEPRSIDRPSLPSRVCVATAVPASAATMPPSPRITSRASSC